MRLPLFHRLSLPFALLLLAACGQSGQTTRSASTKTQATQTINTPVADPEASPSGTPDAAASPTPSASPDPTPTPTPTPTPQPPVSLSLSGPAHVKLGKCEGPFTITTLDTSGTATEVSEDLTIAFTGKAKTAELYQDSACSQTWAETNGSPMIPNGESAVETYRKVTNATAIQGKDSVELSATMSSGATVKSAAALDVKVGGVQFTLSFPTYYQGNTDPACVSRQIYNRIFGYAGCGPNIALTGFEYPTAGAAVILSNPETAPGVFAVTACVSLGSQISVVCETP